MNLAAKASRGYAMAALLVAMSVMAVLLSVALTTWSHMIRREKEEELIFRGTQYARAINQYQRKFANASPPSIDVLLEQHMLRKKFKDPLAPDKDGEFQLLYLSTEGAASRGAGAGAGAGGGAGAGAGGRGSASGRGGAGADSGAGSGTGATYSTRPAGGIVGVASKNTGQSIRVYKGKTHYNEWQFIGLEQSTQAGGGAGGAGGAAGGRGGGSRGSDSQRGGSRGDGRRGAGDGSFGERGGGVFVPRRGGPGGL